MKLMFMNCTLRFELEEGELPTMEEAMEAVSKMIPCAEDMGRSCLCFEVEEGIGKGNTNMTVGFYDRPIVPEKLPVDKGVNHAAY